MVISRRDFLGTIAAGAAMKAAPPAELQRIGLQLCTVRDLLNSDFEGTLTKIALLGY
ncbi:twin-arginine translocation signal domain-containing protein [Bradyrhizobium sp. STM 3557]|uniref:twin-arginine translocation signal domain-containing protein n=1 Tax=Bradyrhizobium sp. STM 3557 TaxID=578920 RepID=UPI00388E986E